MIRTQIEDLNTTLETKAGGLEETLIGRRHTTKKLSREDYEYAMVACTAIQEALELLDELGQVDTSYEGDTN